MFNALTLRTAEATHTGASYYSNIDASQQPMSPSHYLPTTKGNTSPPQECV